MTPSLDIDLDKIRHNAASVSASLPGIAVMGVTKAVLGSVPVAKAMLQGGVMTLGDSRIENIERLRRGGVRSSIALLRSPLPHAADRVVASADLSLNSELEVIEALSAAAVRAGRTHGILLMVEMGDLREGLLMADVRSSVEAILTLPGLKLRGLGTNLACLTGAAPDDDKMQQLSELAASIEETFGIALDIVSGGNSANLTWAQSHGRGRIDQLRLGEAILLGRETLHRTPMAGLHTDAFTLQAEVIECKKKPSAPWGDLAQTAFGEAIEPEGGKDHWRTLLAVGRQDCDPAGLTPAARILGASSDHLVIEGHHAIGDEVSFQLDYGALLRAMTSPFVEKRYRNGGE